MLVQFFYGDGRQHAVIFTVPAEAVFPLRIFSRPKSNLGRQKSNFLDQKHFLSKFHPFYITPSFCTHREKIDLADSEKRTPEVKFRPFFIIIPKNRTFDHAKIKFSQ